MKLKLYDMFGELCYLQNIFEEIGIFGKRGRMR